VGPLSDLSTQIVSVELRVLTMKEWQEAQEAKEAALHSQATEVKERRAGPPATRTNLAPREHSTGSDA
jgi:hypothetical protein